MPAVTVDNILTLPRVTQPTPDAVSCPVLSVSTAPKSFEGEGFPVRRAFAGVDMARLDPFIHMDQMGESSTPPVRRAAPAGTRTADSRRSPTSSTAPSPTRTPMVAAA